MTSKHVPELGVIKLTDIALGERFRTDYGDVSALAADIKEKGLIHPVAVTVNNKEGEPPYKLAAGGRRFAAYLVLGEEEIKCRIYTTELTDFQLRSIELSENVSRKDLGHMEKNNLIEEVDRLWKEQYGVKTSTSPDAPGHSSRDTADIMGLSVGNVSQALKLVEGNKMFPELELDKCKTQNEALKKLENFKKTMVNFELAKQASEQLNGNLQKLTDSYIISDVLEGMSKFQEGVFDLIEVDPPFAINLQKLKKSDLGYEASYQDSYHEIDQSEYREFLKKLCSECYRVAARDSWIIFWYAPEPWAEDVFLALTNAGFIGKRMPAVWTKPSGQCMQPKYNLANVTEWFYYMRKGQAEIQKQGRSNEFPFSPVHPTEKIHPTERPLDMMKEILNTFARPASRILVPFAGSGVTLQAAFELNMFARGFDLSEEYRNAFVMRILKGKEVK